MTIKQIVKNLSLTNIFAFLQGTSRKILIDVFRSHLEHVFEQVEERKNQVSNKSPKCISSGQCVYCHCTTPDLFFADKGCKNPISPCYTEMLSADDWKTEKNRRSIKMNVELIPEENPLIQN